MKTYMIDTYTVEVITNNVALIFRTGIGLESPLVLNGCVFIDESGAWNVRYSAGAGDLPVNGVLSLLGYEAKNQ